MKVTRNTETQLILSETPWFIGIMLTFFILTFTSIGIFLVTEGEWAGLIFGFVGGGMGVAGFAVFVQRVQVILNRDTNDLIIRRRSLFGYSEIQHQLSDLGNAVLEHTTSSKGNTLYRPVLVLTGGMSAGRHPIVESYTNTRGRRRRRGRRSSRR